MLVILARNKLDGTWTSIHGLLVGESHSDWPRNDDGWIVLIIVKTPCLLKIC